MAIDDGRYCVRCFLLLFVVFRLFVCSCGCRLCLVFLLYLVVACWCLLFVVVDCCCRCCTLRVVRCVLFVAWCWLLIVVLFCCCSRV